MDGIAYAQLSCMVIRGYDGHRLIDGDESRAMRLLRVEAKILIVSRHGLRVSMSRCMSGRWRYSELWARGCWLTTSHWLGSKVSLTRQRFFHDASLRGEIPWRWMPSLVSMTWPGIPQNEPTGTGKRILSRDRQRLKKDVAAESFLQDARPWVKISDLFDYVHRWIYVL